MDASDRAFASIFPASDNLVPLAAIMMFTAITPTIPMTVPAVAAQLVTQ